MFKKIVTATGCILILLFMNISGQKLLFENGDYYIFYSGNSGSSSLMVTAEGVEALKVKSTIKDLSGESAYYLNVDKSAEILENFNAKVIFTQSISDIKNIYAYSEEIEDYIILNGQKINLHIAVTKDKTVAGSPIIFGGY